VTGLLPGGDIGFEWLKRTDSFLKVRKFLMQINSVQTLFGKNPEALRLISYFWPRVIEILGFMFENLNPKFQIYLSIYVTGNRISKFRQQRQLLLHRQ